MEVKTFFIYLILMAGVTYLVRALPLVIFRKKINSRFIQSFLTYMPYAVLGCMTVPAIIYSTGDLVSGCIGSAVGAVMATKTKNLLLTAVLACAAVLAVKLIRMAV